MNFVKVSIVAAVLVLGTFGVYRFVSCNKPVLNTIYDARSNRTIIIKRITDNFVENEPGFRASILKLFKDHPKVMEGAFAYFPTIDAIVKSSFEYEQKEFDAQKPGAYFIHALVDGKPVGYVSFDIQPNGSAYMRQLTVDTACQGMGIGKYLAFSIFTIRPEITKITLNTNRYDVSAVGFYKHIGFAEGPLTPQKDFNPDPKLWLGLEFTKSR